MKKSIFVLVLLGLVVSGFCNSGKFSLTTDFSHKPFSEPIAIDSSDEVARFAPLSGAYSGLEFRVTGKYNYVIPTPFGTNPLVKGNNVNLSGALEVTPVTLASQVGVSFTPIAFLNFSASSKIGTGWDFIGVPGHSEYVSNESGFEKYPSLKNFYYECKLSGLFQFDLAAVLPGDWNHVVTLASYDLIYKGVNDSDIGKPAMWQATEFFQGWNFYSAIVLGYQMPLILQTVGIQFEFEGLLSDKNIDKSFMTYDPTFVRIAINPIFILKFNEKHSLTVQLGFSSRRGFSAEKPEDVKTNHGLQYNGREWYFYRTALSYSIKF